MKLNVYKNQKEIEKTYEVDTYDLMYGTVEDILGIFDEMEDYTNNMEILKVVQKNRTKVNDLLKDVFPGITDAELRNVKLKELVVLFVQLFEYVKTSFGDPEKN